eukprot:SAG31_NODE_314_length_17854_cov_3.932075_1_plen_181_part_00
MAPPVGTKFSTYSQVPAGHSVRNLPIFLKKNIEPRTKFSTKFSSARPRRSTGTQWWFRPVHVRSRIINNGNTKFKFSTSTQAVNFVIQLSTVHTKFSSIVQVHYVVKRITGPDRPIYPISVPSPRTHMYLATTRRPLPPNRYYTCIASSPNWVQVLQVQPGHLERRTVPSPRYRVVTGTY